MITNSISKVNIPNKSNAQLLETQSMFKHLKLQEIDSTNDNLQIFNVYSTDYPLRYTKWLQISAYKKRVGDSKKIITILKIFNINASKKDTIILSHGIRQNLDSLFPLLIDLSSSLKCSIISYDYSEYNNKYSIEENLSNDLYTLLIFVNEFFKIRINDIILFSFSLGSIPTFFVAAQEKFKKLKGLILTSPLSSGSCIYNTNIGESSIVTLSNNDNKGSYTNQKLVKNILIPTLIIHGKRDKIIPYQQSENLSKLLTNNLLWAPSNGEHESLYKKQRHSFIKRVSKFINEDIINISLYGPSSSMENLKFHKQFTNTLDETSFSKSFEELDTKNEKDVNTTIEIFNYYSDSSQGNEIEEYNQFEKYYEI